MSEDLLVTRFFFSFLFTLIKFTSLLLLGYIVLQTLRELRREFLLKCCVLWIQSYLFFQSLVTEVEGTILWSFSSNLSCTCLFSFIISNVVFITLFLVFLLSFSDTLVLTKKLFYLVILIIWRSIPLILFFYLLRLIVIVITPYVVVTFNMSIIFYYYLIILTEMWLLKLFNLV